MTRGLKKLVAKAAEIGWFSPPIPADDFERLVKAENKRRMDLKRCEDKSWRTYWDLKDNIMRGKSNPEIAIVVLDPRRTLVGVRAFYKTDSAQIVAIEHGDFNRNQFYWHEDRGAMPNPHLFHWDLKCQNLKFLEPMQWLGVGLFIPRDRLEFRSSPKDETWKRFLSSSIIGHGHFFSEDVGTFDSLSRLCSRDWIVNPGAGSSRFVNAIEMELDREQREAAEVRFRQQLEINRNRQQMQLRAHEEAERSRKLRKVRSKTITVNPMELFAFAKQINELATKD